MNNKKLSIIFEKAISNFLYNNGFVNSVNSFNGIDIFIPKINVFIEIKTCYRYKKRSNSNQLIQCQFGIKNKQIDLTDYYIFIILNNKKNNLEFIKSISVKVFSKYSLIQYIKENNCNGNIYRFFLSYNQVNKISYFNLKQLINRLKVY